MKGLKLGIGIQIIVGVVVVGLIFAVFFFIEGKKVAELTKYRKEKQDVNDKIRKAENKLRLQKQIKREMADVQAKLEEIKRRMPDNSDLPQLIKDIQNAADQAGVDFASIKPGELTSLQEYSEIPIEMSINTRFFDLVDFLYRLHNLPREVKITSLSISEGEDGLPNLSVNIKASAYTFAKGAQVKKEGAPSTEAPPSGTSGESSGETQDSSGQSTTPESGTREQPSTSP